MTTAVDSEAGREPDTTDSMSIGMVCYPGLGGSGIVASELAAALAARGHRVHVIASAPPTRELDGNERLFFHEVAVPDYPPFEHPPYTLAVAASIARVASEHRLDLVQLHYAVPHAAGAYLARQVLGQSSPRFVATLHGTDVTHAGVDIGFRSITRFAVAACDGITVPSQFLRREAYRLLELRREVPIEVIPNFVDTDRFAPPPRRDRARFDALFPSSGEAGDGPVLIHVSNFRPVKRAADLIELLVRVRKHIPARLVLVGDGPERARVVEHAASLGIAHAVCSLGRRSAFVEYLEHADAFVLTSETESFGVAALEALSTGVPVFGYRVGGLAEVVAEGTGVLVEPFDVDALARAVLEHLADPDSQAARSRAARAHARAEFRRGPIVERYEAYFRTVLGIHARRESR